jgi:hypothetical protein
MNLTAVLRVFSYCWLHRILHVVARCIRLCDVACEVRRSVRHVPWVSSARTSPEYTQHYTEEHTADCTQYSVQDHRKECRDYKVIKNYHSKTVKYIEMIKFKNATKEGRFWTCSVDDE